MKRVEVQVTPENIDRIRALRLSGRRPAAVEVPELGVGPWFIVSVSALEARPVYGKIELEYWTSIEALRPSLQAPVRQGGAP